MYLVTGVRDSSSRYVGYCFPVFSLLSLLIMSVLALGPHMQQVMLSVRQSHRLDLDTNTVVMTLEYRIFQKGTSISQEKDQVFILTNSCGAMIPALMSALHRYANPVWITRHKFR
jgi:cytochrome c biogenesis protein ResB